MSFRPQIAIASVFILFLVLIGSLLELGLPGAERVVRAEEHPLPYLVKADKNWPPSPYQQLMYGEPTTPSTGSSSPTATPVYTPIFAIDHENPNDVIRIITGRLSNYGDSQGNIWLSDRYVTGGYIVHRGSITIETSDPEIYRRERWGMSGYAIPVVNGSYRIRLHFAETNPNSGPNWRVFDVNIEGQKVIDNLDIYSETGGLNKILIKAIDVTISDGMLNIDFLKGKENPEINGIEVLPHSPNGTTKRINSGGVTTTSDRYGNPWQADQYFMGGSTANRGSLTISVEDPEIYRTERWDMDGYAVPLSNGTYTVYLHFAETNNNSTFGWRLFDVDIEGERVLDDFDIYTESGGLNTILIKKFTVIVNDGTLNIDFINVQQDPEINGIEIFLQAPGTITPSPTVTRTPTQTPTGTQNPPTLTPTGTQNPPILTPTRTPTVTSTPVVNYNSKVYIPWMTNVWISYFNSLVEIEPNNTALNANGPLQSGTIYQGRFCSPINCSSELALGTTSDTIDYYRFYVGAPQTVVNISLSNIPAGHDYDLYLRDATATNNIGVSNNNSNAPESIVLELEAGVYYILVYNPFKKPSNLYYQLRVSH